MNKYQGVSDEQLILRFRDGEQEIMDYLMEKYKNLVRKNAKAMFLIGGDSEDLIQEGMIGLFKAVRDYREDKDASFFSFADLCIARQIYTAVKAAKRQKHIPLNTYISLYASPEYREKNENGVQLIEQLEAAQNDNPEELVISRENVDNIYRKLENNLSRFEREVMVLSIAGNSYGQIAKLLDKSPKSIDNALQRIKTKMAVLLK